MKKENQPLGFVALPRKEQETPTLEEAFRENIHNYLVCFIESCPLNEQCLRWLVGQYADTMPSAQIDAQGQTPHHPRRPRSHSRHLPHLRQERPFVYDVEKEDWLW